MSDTDGAAQRVTETKREDLWSEGRDGWQVLVLHCVSKKPDHCYIFKWLQQQSYFNINKFWYRESSINRHLIAIVTLR